MEKYSFIGDFLSRLKEPERSEYVLPPGKEKKDLIKQCMQSKLVIPDEIFDFYSYTYAPRFNEYNFFTVEEINGNIKKSEFIYRDLWNNSLIPFSSVLGVGDLVVFNLQKKNEEGYQILDGFHELPPVEWREICYGLENWLRLMINNQFKPFWY